MNLRAPIVAFLGAILLVLAIAVPFAPTGLLREAWADARPGGIPMSSEVDREISTTSIDRLERRTGTATPRLRWSGYLYVDEQATYRFGIYGIGRVSLTIDARPVIEGGEPGPGERIAGVVLAPGPHLFAIDYERSTPASNFRVRWSRGEGRRFEPIPDAALAPRRFSKTGWRVRALIQAPVIALSVLLSVGVLLLAGRAMLRWLEVPTVIGWRLMALSLALILAAIWWGWPGSGWGADELTPDVVRPALDARFMGGWNEKWPPFHYMLLALTYLPMLAADAAGLLSAWSPRGFATLLMLGRFTSVVMGIGTLIVIAAITERYYGRRAAQWAVICCLAFLPFAFYAKLANLDLPYVFWFVVALWCWIKLEADPRPRWYAALGIAAALSIATKDQAYALFVLPGLVIAVRAVTRYGMRGLRLVLVAGAASAVAFALAHNLPLNPSGFAAHIDQLTGLQSNANFRMFPATLAGLWALWKVTMSLITWNIGVPGMLLTLIGLTAATQARPHPRWLLLLPMISYLVLFVGLAGYQYDRFLLPLCVVLPILAGAGADRLTAWPGSRRAQTAIAVLVAVALLWRPAVIDLMMIRDARVAADAWLEAAVQPHHTVGSFGRDLYLPRLDGFERVPLNGFIDDTLARRPTFIVLNAEYNRRYLSHETHAAWMQWLQSGASPYAEVFRYKAPVPAPAVGLFALMRDRDENPFSNLDKINPEILILQLRESVQQPHLR